MTKFESNVFDFVESIFGTDVAIQNYRFGSNAAAAFMYLCYVLTLPIKFVKLVWKNLKEKGVI